MKLKPFSALLASSVLVITGFTVSPVLADEAKYGTLDPVELSENVGLVVNEDSEELEKSVQDYVETAFELEEKTRETEVLRRSAQRSQAKAIKQSLSWESRSIESDLAYKDAEEKRKVASDYARDVYKYGMSPESSGDAEKVLFELATSPDKADDKISAYNQAKHRGTKNKERMDVAEERESDANILQIEAQKSKTDSQKEVSDSVKKSENARIISEKMGTTVLDKEQQYQEISLTTNAAVFTSEAEEAEKAKDKKGKKDKKDEKPATITIGQRAINQVLVDRWNDYLTDLDEANVKIPTLKQLQKEDFLEKNKDFVAYLNLDGEPTDNVVALKEDPSTYVLPKETIETVSTQLRELGDAYSKKGNGEKDKWSCSAFASLSYGDDLELSLDDMWNSSAEVEDLDKLPGDTVFFGSSDSGLHHAGTYLGGGMVVASSLPSKHVSVEPIGYNSFGVKRPSEDAEDKQRKAPEKSEESLDWECGGLPNGASDKSEWVVPIADGAYDIETEFNDKDPKRWGSTNSPGMEFILKEPETESEDETKDDSKEKSDETDKAEEEQNSAYVRASAEGVAKVSETKDWGKTVKITHKDKISTVYTHMDTVSVKNGAQVSKGETLGIVGDSGKKAFGEGKDSLMFMMEKDEKPVDPRDFLFPEAPDAASAVNIPVGEFKNDYSNGKLPDSVLCALPNHGGHKLRCEVLSSFMAMSAAYKMQFGHDICVTDSYRSYEAQVDVKRRKGHWAATPGTSNHGWGLALDLCDNVNIFGSEQYNWMKANAHNYGWFHPDWAEPNGSLPEAWHWEHVYSKSIK